MAEKIFVSYAYQDRDVLNDLESVLRQYGVVSGKEISIIDTQHIIQSAGDIRAAIKDQINAASQVIIIASENSEGSQWVNYEAGMADALGKPITVAVTGRFQQGKSTFANVLGKAQFIDIGEVSARNNLEEGPLP